MKKLFALLLVIVGCFALIVVMNMKSLEVKKEGSSYDKEDLKPPTVELIGNKDYENIIIPSKLEEKIKKGEDLFVYFFSPECVYCQEMTPTLMKVAGEEKVHIDQYNLLEYPQGFEQYGMNGTPVLIHYVDGKEVDRIEGLYPEEETRNFLTYYRDKK